MKDLKTLFQRCGADALVVISDKNRLYFTGFASTFGYLVLTKDKSIFITDPRYFEMAQSLEEKGIEVRQIANGVSATALLVSVLKDIGAKTVGYEDTELTVNQFQTLQKELAEFSLLPCGGDVNYVRSFKDEEEISLIRKAQSVTDAAFKQLLKVIRVGMTEIDIRVELEYLLAKNGGEGLAFDTIVASGVNTSKPHAHPTDKVVENGDAVTMDFGARYHGYCSDMTRTVFVGEPVAEMRKIYNVVLMAHCQRTLRHDGQRIGFLLPRSDKSQRLRKIFYPQHGAQPRHRHSRGAARFHVQRSAPFGKSAYHLRAGHIRTRCGRRENRRFAACAGRGSH